MNHAFRSGKAQVNFPVDEALAVALRRGCVDGRAVAYPVCDEVFARFDERGRAGVVGGDEVLFAVHGVADGDVTEGVGEPLRV